MGRGLEPSWLEWSYDTFPRIEAEFQAALDRSLNPRGPDVLYELVEEMGLPAGSVAVDGGCAEGNHTFALTERFDFVVTGVDPVARHIELALAVLDERAASDPTITRRIRFVAGTAEALPLYDETVDLIWCRDVLVHVADLERAYAEFQRVLRANGRVLIYQMFAGDRLEPREAEWLWKTAGVVQTSAACSHGRSHRGRSAACGPPPRSRHGMGGVGRGEVRERRPSLDPRSTSAPGSSSVRRAIRASRLRDDARRLSVAHLRDDWEARQKGVPPVQELRSGGSKELASAGLGGHDGVGSAAMATRDAVCSCGQLQLTAEGDPIRISMCHCLASQRRTGSAFGIQARFRSKHVHIVGRHRDYVRTSDESEQRTFHFCPDCGATVFYTLSAVPDVVAVPIGAFAEPAFPPPTVSVYESRRHPWLTMTAAMEHHD